jgi:hypothetical protein
MEFRVRLTTFLCKNLLLQNPKNIKTGSNLAESSKEGYGSKKTVLPMMTMMMKN